MVARCSHAQHARLCHLALVSFRSGATRDFDAKERRHKQAARLFRQGKSQADALRELEVSRQIVDRWHAEWISGGTSALRAEPVVFPNSTGQTFARSSAGSDLR